MALILAEFLSMFQGLASHFVTGSATFTQQSDYEWTYTSDIVPSVKANMIGGALADIILYGAQVLDQILQVMVVPSA
jgi:hypothetical protein